MYGLVINAFGSGLIVNGLTEYVEYSSESILSYGNGYGSSGSDSIHASDKTVGGSHCYASDRVVSEMLRNLDNQL